MLNSAIQVEKNKLLKEQAFCRSQFQAVRHAWGHLFSVKETRHHALLADRNADMEPEIPQTPVQRVVASTDTQTLRRIVRALEADIIQAAEDTNGKGTQAHVGMLEMLEAAGAELDRRRRFNEPGPAPAVPVSTPWDHVEWESGPGGDIRLPGGIRVF